MLIPSLILAATLTTSTKQVLAHYEKHEAKQLVPLLTEVIRFQTYQFNDEAHAEQKAWLMKTAKNLGFVARDAGKITEIELPGPAGAPVLGLVIHGDVVPVDEGWTFQPFEGLVQNGYVLGRGAADDKGPLAQALMAMKALKESKIKRTHTIRLLIGSEEESSAGEMGEYLKTHAPPDYSLVLDSEFPVVVGEKAWDGLAVATPLTERPGSKFPYTVESLEAGLSPSIVPDRAAIALSWKIGVGAPDPEAFGATLAAVPLPEGTRLGFQFDEERAVVRVAVYGKAAHAGVNITGGRNALVALAQLFEGRLPPGGANDLLAFVRVAGQDLYGTGLGITDNDPLWGRYAVNVATIRRAKKEEDLRTVLFINLRRIPPRTAPEAKAHLESFIREFNGRTGASLALLPEESYFEDEPLGFDPNAKLIQRLMAVYTRATGEKAKPAISGGGTYAKRLPNAIAFGMWFPGKPYPGHDLDEKIPIDDLHRGARVLIHALVDIATGAKIEEPFK